MVEKNNTQKVLGYFFDNPTTEIHLRELSRKMKLSMPTILNVTQTLTKEGLINVKKSRHLSLLKANAENKQFMRTKRLHNIEQLYKSGLVDELNSKFRSPQAIVCFGSYSRGEDIETSDVDIALIGANETPVAIDKFERTIKRKISIHVVDLSKTSKEFRTNVCNGIILEGAL